MRRQRAGPAGQGLEEGLDALLNVFDQARRAVGCIANVFGPDLTDPVECLFDRIVVFVKKFGRTSGLIPYILGPKTGQRRELQAPPVVRRQRAVEEMDRAFLEWWPVVGADPDAAENAVVVADAQRGLADDLDPLIFRGRRCAVAQQGVPTIPGEEGLVLQGKGQAHAVEDERQHSILDIGACGHTVAVHRLLNAPFPVCPFENLEINVPVPASDKLFLVDWFTAEDTADGLGGLLGIVKI